MKLLRFVCGIAAMTIALIPTMPAPGQCAPSENNCFQPAKTPFCSDPECCAAVCAQDDFCCCTAWDSICAAAAQQKCGSPACGPDAGACNAPHPTPGCDNVICCKKVCLIDPFCCDVAWDSLCVFGAVDLGCTPPPDPCLISDNNCFTPGAGPGCNDQACCDAVCAQDPFCCDSGWDSICAGEAQQKCGNPACGPGAGPCDASNGTPGCDDAACCKKVCLIDPYCCEVSWNGFCVSGAIELGCVPPPECPPSENDCFAPGIGPGCNDPLCCATVCALDPYCCTVSWNIFCALEAQETCGLACTPEAGPCNVPHETPGCDDPACCKQICLIDPFCCEVAWDSLCVQAAIDAGCAALTGCPPNDNNCFQAAQGPGCSDPVCCEIVCAQDSFCCDTTWDSICAGEAQQKCGSPACSATAGPCNVPHKTPGCDNPVCCKKICLIDAFCCAVEWDELCAQAAVDKGCAPPSVCPPNDNNCFVKAPTPGCGDPACCEVVCAQDPFCCDIQWDVLCAGEAQQKCGNPACPGTGNCFEAHGGLGCSDAICCKKVCAQDPFCCEVAWDSICADEALAKCSNPACPAPGHCLLPHANPGCNDPICCNSVCAVDPFCCETAWDGICAGEASDLCPDITCAGDVDGNGMVNVQDLVLVILNWACTEPPQDCPADANRDGVVDVQDLVLVVLNWGVCPG